MDYDKKFEYKVVEEMKKINREKGVNFKVLLKGK
jgi:hypothetical protein